MSDKLIIGTHLLPPVTTPGYDGADYNAQWVAAGGSSDINTPPASPNGMDDEFADTSLDGKWTWRNQGTATWTEAGGYAIMTLPSQAGDTSRFIYQARGAGDFTATAKIWLPPIQLNFMTAGICLYNSANGYRTYMAMRNENAVITSQVSMQAHVLKMTSDTAWSADSYNVTRWGLGPMYVRINRTGTTLTYSYSDDGINFVTALSEATATFMNAVTSIGLGHWRNNNNAAVYNGRFDWFRVV